MVFQLDDDTKEKLATAIFESRTMEDLYEDFRMWLNKEWDEDPLQLESDYIAYKAVN